MGCAITIDLMTIQSVFLRLEPSDWAKQVIWVINYPPTPTKPSQYVVIRRDEEVMRDCARTFVDASRDGFSVLISDRLKTSLVTQQALTNMATDEDDYLTMTFEDPAPAPQTEAYSQRRARKLR